MTDTTKAALRATFPAEERHDGARNLSPDKETTRRDVAVAFDAQRERGESYGGRHRDDRMRQVIDARWYMGRSSQASTVYCSVWIRTRDGRTFTGHGSAGGYGYHKESAAFDEALTSAGVKLSDPHSVHGCGDGPIRDAMEAVMKAAGYGRKPWAIV